MPIWEAPKPFHPLSDRSDGSCLPWHSWEGFIHSSGLSLSFIITGFLIFTALGSSAAVSGGDFGWTCPPLPFSIFLFSSFFLSRNIYGHGPPPLATADVNLTVPPSRPYFTALSSRFCDT